MQNICLPLCRATILDNKAGSQGNENENSFQGKLIKGWQSRIRVSCSLALKVIAYLLARKEVHLGGFLR